ncbi:30S ribosomal protein S13 [Candidatus Woesearchaeota archaeon]|jgi:small subunit ribosomal protein S13|nr:30S ribosomal protein S13 [Candidatus Woesearchaeota archaeon]MBT5396995.1 30S ribosomal protein S13 [Candidatus Woesearchaeota archaeon]MBT5924974.1 30S ribosomal protein S13 [Candidatus Woesearchaeota archaeon]MBT6367459.1 30S ribosomal protein S13 [Candidatus Woesearchaeota archaeon]MBT7762395.1 30S ribosomal protein S13 [Candidatus Woesearchaeota archaeon]
MAENQTYKHIVRIAQVDVPGDKPIRIALTKIKGVGINLADIFCTVAGIDKRLKAGNLSADNVESLNGVIKDPLSHGIPAWICNRQKDYETGEHKHILTSTLNFTLDNDIKRLKKIKSLRGMRHQKKLPLRGQRTRSNFRRSKGKVVGVRKKATAKKGK